MDILWEYTVVQKINMVSSFQLLQWTLLQFRVIFVLQQQLLPVFMVKMVKQGAAKGQVACLKMSWTQPCTSPQKRISTFALDPVVFLSMMQEWLNISTLLLFNKFQNSVAETQCTEILTYRFIIGGLSPSCISLKSFICRSGEWTSASC